MHAGLKVICDKKEYWNRYCAIVVPGCDWITAVYWQGIKSTKESDPSSTAIKRLLGHTSCSTSQEVWDQATFPCVSILFSKHVWGPWPGKAGGMARSGRGTCLTYQPWSLTMLVPRCFEGIGTFVLGQWPISWSKRVRKVVPSSLFARPAHPPTNQWTVTPPTFFGPRRWWYVWPHLHEACQGSASRLSSQPGHAHGQHAPHPRLWAIDIHLGLLKPQVNSDD